MGDKEIPYRLLKKVMATCTGVGLRADIAGCICKRARTSSMTCRRPVKGRPADFYGVTDVDLPYYREYDLPWTSGHEPGAANSSACSGIIVLERGCVLSAGMAVHP